MTITLDQEMEKFLQRALADADRFGSETAVLIVGSRAAGLVDDWSDLDIWMFGHKNGLPQAQRAECDRTGQVFVDRSDGEAHYIFYDLDDLKERLSGWPDEMLWILRTAAVVRDRELLAADLKDRYRDYPRDVLERKLRWWFLKYWLTQAGLGVAGRGMAVATLVTLAQCVEALCKVACLADGVPFPYSKWLRRVAGDTRLGKVICPAIDRAVAAISEATAPPEGRFFRELVPVRELRSLKDALQTELPRLGWSGDWAQDPTRFYWLLVGQTAP